MEMMRVERTTQEKNSEFSDGIRTRDLQYAS